MRIFSVRADSDHYQYITVMNEEDSHSMDSSEAQSLAATWRPVPVRLITADANGKSLLRTDFPGFLPDCFIFNVHALEALKECVEGHGELLPLNCNAEELFFFNVTSVIDALDMDQSSVSYSKSTGRILWIDRHVFKKERIGNTSIFKLPVLTSHIFVTDTFVDAVVKHVLRGFEFEQLWEGK